MTEVRAVWTDFGGVLTPPVAETQAAYCARVGVPADVLHKAVRKVTETYGTTDPMEPLDTPMVGEETWTRQVEQVLADDFGLVPDLGDFGAAWFDDRPANAEWLSRLAALRAGGVFVGMLSNMVPTWDARWRAMLPEPAETLFDGVLMSFEVGARKPMREIFDLAARTASAGPGQCVLVDDLARNCAGARAAGWRAIEFEDAAQAAAVLTDWTGTNHESERNGSGHD